MVRNVPGRSNILIHAYNNALAESKGCIAPVNRITGEGEGDFSRLALAKLISLVYPVLDKEEPVFLIIKS